ncbi:MAG: DUF1501 domain-containing protein [Bryobacterales bacterium]
MLEKFLQARQTTRRHFLQRCQLGLAGMFLGDAMGAPPRQPGNPLAPKKPHFAPKAKSVIYLHMAGSPTQLELWDPKPELQKYDGKDCPQHLLEGKRFAFIKGTPKLLGTPYKFQKYGQAGTDVSELLPHFSTVVDDVAVIRSMTTDQFNHAPAQLFLHTGNPRLGAASMGSWATYGLGTENQDLAGLRGAGQRQLHAQRRQEPVGLGLSAVGLPGRSVSHPRRPGALPERPRGYEPIRAPQDARCARRPQTPCSKNSPATLRPKLALRSTKPPTVCRFQCPR